MRISPAWTLAAPLAAALAAGAGGCSAGHSTAPSRATFDGATFPPGVKAPELRLTDQRGQAVSLSQYRGRVTVVAFVPAGRPAGRLVAQQIRGALDELGPRVAQVGAVLVDAQGATARARVRARGSRLLEHTSLLGHAAYLTGTAAQLRAVWKAYGLPAPSAGERAYLASTPVIVIDRTGIERVGFPVEGLTPEGLAHDIALLIHER